MAVDPQYVRRTDQKLRYALVHVDELHAYINQGANDDWENAHEESCLFHLVGAVESTFSEMNDVYGLGLAEHEIGFRKLKECAATNPDLQKTFKVYTDARDGWLGLVYEIRNVMAHRRHHGKLVQMGGGPNSFVDPRTPGAFVPGTTTEALARFSRDAKLLIEELRKSYP